MMTVSSKPVILVVTSVLAVALIFAPSSSSAKTKYGPITCQRVEGDPTLVTCCQTQTDSKEGIEIKYCTVCANTSPPSHCGPRYAARTVGGVLPSPTGNSTGVSTGLGQVNATSLGGVLPPPTGNSTGVPTGLTATKALNSASPKLFSSTAGNVTNTSNSTGPVKLSPLTTMTSGGHHHHKSSTSSSSNTNSTGH